MFVREPVLSSKTIPARKRRVDDGNKARPRPLTPLLTRGTIRRLNQDSGYGVAHAGNRSPFKSNTSRPTTYSAMVVIATPRRFSKMPARAI